MLSEIYCCSTVPLLRTAEPESPADWLQLRTRLLMGMAEYLLPCNTYHTLQTKIAHLIRHAESSTLHMCIRTLPPM